MCMLIVFIHESHVVFVYVLLLYSLFVSLLFFVCSPIMEEIKYLILSYLSLFFSSPQMWYNKKPAHPSINDLAFIKKKSHRFEINMQQKAESTAKA